MLVLSFIGGAIILMMRRKKTTNTNTDSNTGTGVPGEGKISSNLGYSPPYSDASDPLIGWPFVAPIVPEEAPVESVFIEDTAVDDSLKTVEVVDHKTILVGVHNDKIANMYIPKGDVISPVIVANTAKGTLIKHPRKVAVTQE